MIFFVPMCQIFWHMGTGQKAVPLEPALWHFFVLIFSLSAQCVRHFAPISSNLGSGPTKLIHAIFWNFFFQKKKQNSLQVLSDRSKYPPRHCLLIKSALFYFLIEFLSKQTVFCCFLMIFFVPMCQIFWHKGTGQRAVPLEPALWHPLFLFLSSV